MTESPQVGSRVLDHVEDLEMTGDIAAFSSSDRVAIIAAFSDGKTLRTRDRRYVQALVSAGYCVLFVQANPNGPTSLSWGESETPPGVAMISRRNLGYDFGSWSVALNTIPEIRKASFVLLSNDSLIGPFADIGPLVEKFEQAECDAWSATMNNQFFPHLQSFFMGFKNGILGEPVLRRFWDGIRIQASKEHVVMEYELGLTRLLFSEAYVFDCALPSRVLVDYDQNPSLQAWERLMELGFPFIKKMVIEQPEVAWNAHAAESYIHSTYGQDLQEWFA